MKRILLLILSILTLSCSKNEIANPLYKSECNITNPKKELKWIANESYMSRSDLKGWYLYVYYGFLEKSDSPLLSKLKYFDNKNPRDIVLLRISRKKSNKVELGDLLTIYSCNGNTLVEGWPDEWILISKNLKNKYTFKIQQL